MLKAGKWKAADKETARVMCQAANRSKEEYLREKDIDNFPCTDLRTINQLWLDYSGGKFGFSVQKEIYHRLGGTRDYNQEVWQTFGDTVGWSKAGSWLYYRNITYNISDPQGHLPYSGCGWVGKLGLEWLWVLGGGWEWRGILYVDLFSRVETCRL
nr:GUN4 domain-containing protein [Cyanothece sp. BG0011]